MSDQKKTPSAQNENTDGADLSESESLGSFLRAEREKLGITIEQVASATKISVRLLHALEDDQYSDLPAKPFVFGFVTSYSRFIGLNPKEVRNQFNFFISKKASERPNRDAGHSGYIFEKREGDQSRLFLWIIMGSFILIGGLSMLILKPSLKHNQKKHLETLVSLTPPKLSPSPAVNALLANEKIQFSPVPIQTVSPKPIASQVPSPAPSVPPSVVPSSTPTSAPTAAPSPEPLSAPSPKPDPLNSGAALPPENIKYRLMVKAWADVWVRYQCDDRPLMKFILREGRLLALRGETKILLDVSNAKAVTYNFNRGPSTPMKLKRLVLPASAELSPEFSGDSALPSTPDPAPSPAPEPSPTP